MIAYRSICMYTYDRAHDMQSFQHGKYFDYDSILYIRIRLRTQDPLTYQDVRLKRQRLSRLAEQYERLQMP